MLGWNWFNPIIERDCCANKRQNFGMQSRFKHWVFLLQQARLHYKFIHATIAFTDFPSTKTSTINKNNKKGNLWQHEVLRSIQFLSAYSTIRFYVINVHSMRVACDWAKMLCQRDMRCMVGHLTRMLYSTTQRTICLAINSNFFVFCARSTR